MYSLKNILRVLCVVGSCGLLHAQFDSATVLGTVRDASALPIQTSKVTLLNVQTGISQSALTDDSGNYQFFNVKIGRYKVTAEAQGFKTATAEEFQVTVNARQRVDLRLEVGATTEVITVREAAAALETDTSSRGTVVGSQQIVNLPLNGRSYADLALLVPGVRRSGIAASRDASFNVNGMRSSQNNFVIDGVDNNSYGTSNQGFSNQVVQISPDAVQEFRVETNNYSAEFGRAGGAVINATIRSGTNEFHGAAWNFLRNTTLNATGFFKPVNNQKPSLVQNQFGGALGGPVIRDKAFFFANYEGFRRTSRTITFASIPTLDQRRGILSVPVRNPYTGEVFNGTVPAAQITPFAREVLNNLPAPNRPGLANNFESQPGFTQVSDKGDARYDHYFGSKLTAFVRYSHRLLNQFEPAAIPGLSGGDSNGDVRVLNQQIAYGSTYTISPTSLLEFRMGVSLTEGGKTPLFVGTEGVAQRFGFPNVPTDPRFTGGLYRQAVNGFTAFGVQGSNPQFQNPFVVNPKVNYSKIVGKHSVKAGYEYQAINTEIDDFNPKYGSDSYSGRFSQVSGTPNNNDQFLADFFFGARSQYQLNNAVIVDYRQRMHFFYFQDDWKVTPKLTLNLGVRYEFATPQYEAQNRISNFDAVNNRLLQASDGSLYDRALVNPDRNNWAPRVGLAWSLNDRTVIRSGYGISYLHFNRMGGENILAYNLPHILNPIVDQIAPQANRGLPLCTSTAQSPFSCFRPTQQGYPDGFLSLANINALAVRTNYIPGDIPTGYTQAWHFTIQRQLAKDLVFDVAYVGTRGTNLMILGDFNQARPNGATENLPLQSRRPIQNFGYIQAAFPGGYLNYHALQTKIEKRFGGGLYLLNSFTWSKAIDNASGHLEAQNGDNSRVNYRDLRNERGVSGYNQPFNNTSTVVYDVPFGRGRKWGSSVNAFTNAALGGWRITGINTMTSGLPINLSYSPASQFQVSGAPTYRPNIMGDPLMPEGQRTAQQWLNPATVSLPTDPSRPFGNAGRNLVGGPSFYQLDLGLHKDFPITEMKRIEFRTEAFNLLNKTNFTTPNSNRSSNAFGTITSTFPARQIQFALKFLF
ncbi:MAG: TonB-dependent receptor [Bryobacteraceae bacterium]|nr:TonB-dependent receptor [Bryobacteraceae bacterium]